MKSFLLVFFLALFSLTVQAQNNDYIKIENGISYPLAKYRKNIIDEINYKIHLIIPENKDADIDATETLLFNLKKDENPLQIDFKSDSNAIKEIVVNDKPVQTHYENEHIIIQSKFLKNGLNKIYFRFLAGSSALNRRADFLYTLFVPDHARTMFPCFDQPDLKARFELSLTIPENWNAIANGKLEDSSINNLQKTYQFSVSDILPTYLFSFAAGKFTIAQRPFNNQNITLLYRETDSAKIKNSLDSIFKIYTNSINFYQRWTGISYPFQKYGMVAIPDFQFGGMEHPGAILFQNATLFVDKNATQNQLNSRSNLIAHEVAHQWFGDMVTMKWFTDVWMKEVFANFMADKSTAASVDQQTYDLKFLTTHFPSAYGVERTLGANPIRQKLDNLQNAGMLYGPIIYDKAPIMMRQLELLMGKENFRKGVDEYLKKYAYSNASWNDLISILDKYTDADLQGWNNVWVNETGRPIVENEVRYNGNKIKSFYISQHPEYGTENKIWQQHIAMSLYYSDTVKTFDINLSKQKQEIKQAEGLQKPLFILLNSSGIGYGVFQSDTNICTNFSLLKNPVSRASAYIALYENMLNGKSVTPKNLLDFYANQLNDEKNELNLRMITGYLSAIYWEFITQKNRLAASQILENEIWNALQKQSLSNNKKILFDCYQSIFLSEDAYNNLYNIWQHQTPPNGVILSEDDYTSLALSLALRNNDNAQLLQQQLSRIKNPDRINRFKIIMQAASSDKNIRDSFFNSLSQKQNRTNESAIGAALSYLHHPLRQNTSIGYLKKSLDLLEEIQQTGDIFFPDSWLHTTFGTYQNADAMRIVEDFLKSHPDYNEVLKNKILQATDNLRRAQKLIDE